MYNEEKEILLHDYFDNLLSEEAQTEFEDCLLDNIDLAIELGKLKNLQRNVNNLPSNFNPPEIVIENIINSLLYNKSDSNNLDKKTKNKKLATRQKDKSKQKRKFKPKTKYILKKLILPALVIILVVTAVFSYNTYLGSNKTTPWLVNRLSNYTAVKGNSVDQNKLEEKSILETDKNEDAVVFINNCGKMEISGKSKIKIITGKKLLNLINYYFGNLNFIPDLNNELFQLNFSDINISSSNSQFYINDYSGTPKVNVETNYITLTIDNLKYKVPANHQFVILNKDKAVIPTNKNSSKYFIDLVDSYLINENDAILKQIIKTSTRKETFLLFSLLLRVSPEYREKIINKLEKTFPIPNSTNKGNILMLEQASLDAWWDEIYLSYN